MKTIHYKGVGAGISAGVFWGTPFLAPLILPMFSIVEVTFVRFFFFGLISLLVLPQIIALWRRLMWKDIVQLFLLSASGFWLYTIFLFQGIRLTNGVIGSLIEGTLPLTITLCGKPRWNKSLMLGMCIILAGIFALLILPLLNADQFQSLAHVHLNGILFLLIALAMWTWFAIHNSRFLVAHSNIKSLAYSSTMGLMSLCCLFPIFLLSHDIHAILSSSHLHLFLLWGAILGIGASWIANICWAYCSRTCIPSISGPLIVSETLFGLLYSFLFQTRWPFVNEWLAIFLLICGVIITIQSQSRLE